MPRTIQFHLDENCDGALAKRLKLRGIDVTTSREVGLLMALDEDHLTFANAESRVIVTHDSDFLIMNQVGVFHHGIAYSPKDRRSIGELVRALSLIWETVDDEEMVGQVRYL